MAGDVRCAAIVPSPVSGVSRDGVLRYPLVLVLVGADALGIGIGLLAAVPRGSGHLLRRRRWTGRKVGLDEDDEAVFERQSTMAVRADGRLLVGLLRVGGWQVLFLVPLTPEVGCGVWTGAALQASALLRG